MERSAQSRALVVLASLAGALLLSGAAIAAVSLGTEVRILGVPVWMVSVLAGMLLGLVGLLLFEPPIDAPGSDVLKDTSCAACGKQIIEEWRLCPHCGQLLECDMSLPVERGPSRG